jgi:hypothetical protein
MKTKDQLIEQIQYTKEKHPEKYELAYQKIEKEYLKLGKSVELEIEKENFIVFSKGG